MAAPSALTRTLCTQSLPKQCQTFLGVCSAPDRDPRTRGRRRRASVRPPTTVRDSERLPNTAEPRHCKGISPFASLSSLGLKDDQKKMLCVCACLRACSKGMRFGEQSDEQRTAERPLTCAQSHFYIQVLYSVLLIVWGHMTGIDML